MFACDYLSLVCVYSLFCFFTHHVFYLVLVQVLHTFHIGQQKIWSILEFLTYFMLFEFVKTRHRTLYISDLSLALIESIAISLYLFPQQNFLPSLRI